MNVTLKRIVPAALAAALLVPAAAPAKPPAPITEPIVAGVVATADNKAVPTAVVTVIFRDGAQKLMRTKTVKVDAQGRWIVAIPNGARWTRVKVSESTARRARSVQRVFQLVDGKSVLMLARFPAAGQAPSLIPF
jgi:hypothetical protein